MWHSTHHVLSLAVLNHCPFNTETHNAEPSANPRSDQQSDQQIWEIANHHKMTWWLLCSICSRFKAPPNTTCGMSTSDCRLSDRAGVGSLSGLSDEFEMTDWCIKSNSDALLSVGLIEIFARNFTIWKASNESNASLSLSLHCIVKCLQIFQSNQPKATHRYRYHTALFSL